MQEYTHNCIKCQTSYKDTDPDPYYCPSCVEEKKAIAKEVDNKLATRVSKRPQKSELQIISEIQQTKGVNFRGMKFINSKDLGI